MGAFGSEGFGDTCNELSMYVAGALLVYNIRERVGNQAYTLDLCPVTDKIGRCTYALGIIKNNNTCEPLEATYRLPISITHADDVFHEVTPPMSAACNSS